MAGVCGEDPGRAGGGDRAVLEGAVGRPGDAHAVFAHPGHRGGADRGGGFAVDQQPGALHIGDQGPFDNRAAGAGQAHPQPPGVVDPAGSKKGRWGDYLRTHPAAGGKDFHGFGYFTVKNSSGAAVQNPYYVRYGRP